MVRSTLAAAICLCAPVLCLAQATSYTITTVAGSSTSGFGGDGGAPTSAKLNVPIQVAVDAAHNLYIADSGNNRIRKISAGKIATFAGSTQSIYTGDGGAATSAGLTSPYGVQLDASGNVYVADLGNHVVRVVGADGKIATVAGNTSANFTGDGGPATGAALNRPLGIAIAPGGRFYIGDSFNHRVRMVAPDGTISTVAGNGVATYQGDDGPATSASLSRPFGVALDAAGNLYIADSANNRVRKVSTDGTMATVAGTGTAGFSGDGGPANKAQLNRPWDVKVDAAGDLFIADYSNSRIRMVTPDGVITTIAGDGNSGYTGDGAAAVSARLSFPTGIAIDTNGNIFIADSGNNVVRQLTPTAPSVSSGGVTSASAFGGLPAVAPGSWIEIYGTNLSTSRRQWGSGDFQGVNAPTSLDGASVSIGGQAAFIDFVSGGQVNAQVPSNVATGSQQLTVKTAAGTSAAYTVTVAATQPGLLAPPTFNIGGTQYLAAVFTDGAYVLPPGAIPGVPSRRAKAGDTIVLYGIGFGPVSPNIPAGQIVQQTNSLLTAPQISFAGTFATVTYAGLALNNIGLYQFNVVVPSLTASDKVAVTFTLGGAAGRQTLYTAVE